MTAKPPDALFIDSLTTPIGTALLVTDTHGVLRAFDWSDFEARMRTWLARRYQGARLTQGGPSAVRTAFEAYFADDTGALETVRAEPLGTSFQRVVWNALRSIPPGETLSYAGLAARIGRPTAMRAVGLANGCNPTALVIPCHRVIGADGSLTGYGGGLHRKRWLLEHENARFRDRRAA